MQTIILCDTPQKVEFISKHLSTGTPHLYSDDFNENLLEYRNVILWGEFPKHVSKLPIKVLKYFITPDDFNPIETIWKDGEFREYMVKQLKDFPLKTKPKDDEVQSYADNSSFKVLGYDKDGSSGLLYYFFSYEASIVISLSASKMTKSNLMGLAPLSFWRASFGKEATQAMKFDVDMAQQFLIQKCYETGIFKEKQIRGRGAWIDDGRLVIHTGDSLIVDLHLTALKKFPSKYVYEINESLGFKYTKPLSDKEAYKLIGMCSWLNWERPINSYLLAGWCVVAPFCGVLDWRPHAWLTGASGTGKSWVVDNIVKPLLGESCIEVQGATTEAGIRGILQSDAMPVLFDETDVDTDGDKKRVQGVLTFTRSSSAKNGAPIGKGTQSGGFKMFKTRSCFFFSSIAVQLNQQADRSRFTILGLNAFEKENKQQDFEKFTKEYSDMVTPEYVESLQSRTMTLIHVILKNAKTFQKAMSTVLNSRRVSDQVSILISGSYSLYSSKVISYEKAVEWVKARDWTDEKALELTKDEYRLFSKILEAVTRIETEFKQVERSIGEIIMIALGEAFEPSIDSVIATNHLRRLGIMIKDNRLFIANSSEGIKRILKDSPWTVNYHNLLERIPDAKKEDAKQFGPGPKKRSVSIPISEVFDENIKVETSDPNYLNKTYQTDVQDEIPF